MSVIRVHKTKNFTVMSNTHLRDKNLSLKAKGLLSVMLSLPDDWSYSISGLCSICKESETAIKSALNELKTSGYVVVSREEPSKENGGRIRYSYDVYEEPKNEIQEGKIQGVENLGVEFQQVDSVALLNTNIINTKNKNYSSIELKDKDFSEVIIQKIKSLTDNWYLIDCVAYYLRKYKDKMNYSHPDISITALSEFLDNVDSLFNGCYEEVNADNGFIKIIDRHFDYNYKKTIDYKFQHFSSKKILEYQARYFGYVEGYRD